MRWQRLWNYLKKAFSTEVDFLLEVIDQEIEELFHQYKTRLIKSQYLIFAVQLFVIHMIVFLRIILIIPANSVYGEFWQPLIVIGISLIMMALVRWTEHRAVTYFLCLLAYMPYLFYLEFAFLSKPGIKTWQPFSFQFVYILYIMILNHWMMILISNQRTKVYSIMIPLERVYLITRFYLTSESTRTLLFVKGVILLTMQIFFLYYAKQFSLQKFRNLIQKAKHMHQIMDLLDIASPFPVYLFHFEPRLEELIRGEQLSEGISSRNRQEKLHDVLTNLTIEVFHSGSIEKKKIRPAELLMLLDSINFHGESTFLATKDSKILEAGSLDSETVDSHSSNLLPKLLNFSNYEGLSSLDIIVMILDSALGNIKEVHGVVFSLKDLNNNSILNHSDFRVFDIDLMILTLEGQNFFTVTVKEFTKRLIVEKGPQEEHSVDIAISGIVHDMRAPLQAILGYTEHLEYRLQKLHEDSGSNLEAAKKIKAYCQHLDQLTNDILDSTRITNSKLVINVSAFDLRTLIDDSTDMAKTLQKSQTLTFVYRGPAKIQVKNDRHRLKRILMNLLSNSVKNTESGDITVEAELVGNNLVRLSVIDTGKGISQQVQRGLFNPFKNYVDAQNIEGIGLGLATTRELVGRLGPNKQIEVTSQVGKGSIFSFEVFLDFDANLPKQNYSMLASQPFIKIRDNSSKNFSRITRSKERARSLIGNDLTIRSSSYGSNKPTFQTQDSGTSMKKAPLFRSIKKKSSGNPPILKKASITSQENGRFKDPIFEVEEEEQSLPHIVRLKIPNLESQKPQSGSPLLSSGSVPEQSPSFFILEDDPFSQEILSSAISRFLEEFTSLKSPPHVDSSENGLLALKQLEKKAEQEFFYDIVFTDFNVEGEMTGLDFARSVIQLHSKAGATPPVIILISGMDREASEEGSPFSDVLQKPFSYEQLSRKLKKFMFGMNCEG
jgi:signal transduction histidine kinase